MNFQFSAAKIFLAAAVFRSKIFDLDCAAYRYQVIAFTIHGIRATMMMGIAP
jgi:hypothetical protein